MSLRTKCLIYVLAVMVFAALAGPPLAALCGRCISNPDGFIFCGANLQAATSCQLIPCYPDPQPPSWGPPALTLCCTDFFSCEY